MITLWGRLNSANVQKVVWALEELGLAYEHVPAGGADGGTGSAAFLAMNPNGLVPVLRDDDLTLWESHAIVRYLAAQYASGLLYPMAAAERAIADQWTDWTATTFQPAWIGLFWLLVRTPEAGRDPDKIASAVAATVRCLGMMDARLAKSRFLGGAEFSYADIVAGTAMYRWATMPIERPDLHHINAWHGRLKERPAFQMAICRPYDELAGRLAF